MKRRTFLASTGAAAVLGPALLPAATEPPLWQELPRWRGFNLLEKVYRNEQAAFPGDGTATWAYYIGEACT